MRSLCRRTDGLRRLDRRGRLGFRTGRTRNDWPNEGDVEHLVDPPDRMDLERTGNVLRDLRQVLPVLLRNDDGPEAATMRGQQLLLQATGLEGSLAQGDFAGPGHVATYRHPGQGRSHSRALGEAGTRTILRSRAFSHVHVDVVLLVEVRIDVQPADA